MCQALLHTEIMGCFTNQTRSCPLTGPAWLQEAADASSPRSKTFLIHSCSSFIYAQSVRTLNICSLKKIETCSLSTNRTMFIRQNSVEGRLTDHKLNFAKQTEVKCSAAKILKSEHSGKKDPRQPADSTRR